MFYSAGPEKVFFSKFAFWTDLNWIGWHSMVFRHSIWDKQYKTFFVQITILSQQGPML